MGKMSLSAYARHRGVRLNAVQYQIERGIIVRGQNGLIDSDQADAAWAPRTQPNPEQGRRKLQADLTTQLVKFNLAKVQLERLQSKHIERATAVEGVLSEVDEITHALEAAPDRYSGILSGLLGIDQDLARTILARTIKTALDDLGDVRADARHTLDRL